MPKTLVIHPKDPSTKFLEPIYKSIKNKKVVSGDYSSTRIREMIIRYDRVIMMGHGTSNGLFSVGQFPDQAIYVIDHTFADLLREKQNSVYIWCNADEFVESYKLSGFYTGMFISELNEAFFCDVNGVLDSEIEISNRLFSEIAGRYIHLPAKAMLEKVKVEYGKIIANNKVAEYNWKRLFAINL